jgi:hypothetical protein
VLDVLDALDALEAGEPVVEEAAAAGELGLTAAVNGGSRDTDTVGPGAVAVVEVTGADVAGAEADAGEPVGVDGPPASSPLARTW